MKDWQFLKEVERVQGHGRWGRLGVQKGNRRKRSGWRVMEKRILIGQRMHKITGQGLWEEKIIQLMRYGW